MVEFVLISLTITEIQRRGFAKAQHKAREQAIAEAGGSGLILLDEETSHPGGEAERIDRRGTGHRS
jgi:hypothetical protein